MHQLIRGRLRVIVELIRKKDRKLADQLRASASSVAGNLAEGAGSTGGTQRARWESSLGSARETRAHVQSAAAWGYIPDRLADEADAELDRVCAMNFRLLDPRVR